MEIVLVPSPVDNDEQKLRQKHVQERLGYLLTGEKIKTNKQTNTVYQNSGGPLDSQTWQTEWRTAPLAKVQSWEYVNQTLQAFDCGQPFVHQVWLFSGRPEFFTCSYCAWLWNWLRGDHTQVEKYFWPGEITQQIYHWQILPIIFEFSLWSHSSKRISNKLA